MCVTYPMILSNSWFNPHYVIRRIIEWFNKVFVEIFNQGKYILVDVTELWK